MKITKLCFITLLMVASTFSMLFLFSCSTPMSSLKNISTLDPGKGAINASGTNEQPRENIFTVGVGKGVINALAFSPDGKLLAVASSEGIQIYDTRTDTGLTPLTGHDGAVLALAWVDNKTLASGGADTTIRLWNVKTGKLLNTLRGHEGRVNTLVYSSKAKMLASGSRFRKNYFSKLPDKPVKLPPKEPIKLSSDLDELRKDLDKLNRELDDRLNELKKQQDEPGKFDNTIRLWKVSTGELQHTLEGKESAAAFAFTADGKKLRASGNREWWTFGRVEFKNCYRCQISPAYNQRHI